MKVKDKEKLNNPLKGWRILSAISSMVFHTVHWGEVKGIKSYLQCIEGAKIWQKPLSSSWLGYPPESSKPVISQYSVGCSGSVCMLVYLCVHRHGTGSGYRVQVQCIGYLIQGRRYRICLLREICPFTHTEFCAQFYWAQQPMWYDQFWASKLTPIGEKRRG